MSILSMPVRSRPALRLLAALLAALLPWAGPAWGADEPAAPTVKWYEESLNGNKTGWRRVVWAPSTWEGRKTVHDTTTVVSRTRRNMASVMDQFETTSTTDLERGPEGTLWWMRTRTEQAGQVQISELTWTGKGYVSLDAIEGQEPKRIVVPLDKPVLVDAESLLGARARAGTLEAGTRLSIRQLDLRARKARDEEIHVLGKETIKDGAGEEVECFKILQRDPASRSEVLLWLDARGVFVKVRVGSFLILRTTQAGAEEMPAKPAEYSITVPASPRLERIFSADRVLADVHIRAAEHRKYPDFPTSPWSRVVQVEGDEALSRVFHVELRKHDDKEAKATIPVEEPPFARLLESTALMQAEHPALKAAVKEVVGEDRDARTAAYKLARFVFTKLRKQSPEVAQADAVQILKECKGDCSEHALLFVTLCRAAGIPARRCSGYVCIGGIWGAHAWAEIWTGTWIGADPTTGEVGTAARYLFFGYPDEPDSFPGLVSSRISGRIRIVTTHVEEGPASFDLTKQSGHRIYDREHGRYVHVLAGLEARDLPEGWSVDLSHDRTMRVRGPSFTARMQASADQGESVETVGRSFPGARTTFAGAPALLRKAGKTRMYVVFSRRRIVQLYVSGATAEDVQALEEVLAATFADPPLAWTPPAAAPQEEDK